MNLDSYFTTFLKDMTIRGFSPHTVSSYNRYVEDFFSFHPGLAPEDVQEKHISDYLFDLKDVRKLAYSTTNLATASLRSFFHDTLKKNTNVCRIRYHQRGYKIPNIFTLDELKKFFIATNNLKYQAMFETAYSVGLRSSEVLNLKIQDINRDAKTLTVRQGKGRRDRVVKLSERILEILGKYWRSCKDKPTTYFFPGKTLDETILESTMHKFFKKTAALAGILKRVSMHSLRHSFATHALENGMHIQDLQRILGHRNIQTTIKYLHFTTDVPRDVVLPIDLLYKKK